MELAFATKDLRTLCNSECKAEQVLGFKAAEKLKRRLADLRAATNVSELIAGFPAEIDGNAKGQYAVSLCAGFRIIFSSNHNTTPTTKSGSLDWSNVSRVKILKIEKHNG